MNSIMRSYLLIDNSDNIQILEKMLRLISHEQIELVKEENAIKISEVSMNGFTRIASSLETLASDLELNEIALVVVPFYDSKLINSINIHKNGVFFLYDLLLEQYSKNELDIQGVTSILDNVPKEILLTVKNYIRLNQSLVQTGELMFAHRNTINYRINKFINVTSINVREMQNAVLVYFIITLMDIN